MVILPLVNSLRTPVQLRLVSETPTPSQIEGALWFRAIVMFQGLNSLQSLRE
uniref:Uncharacterized protein n=1 Tax=Anguilla anguilla TaxID=7936 RepID=A0A0E9TVD7_ANGAN